MNGSFSFGSGKKNVSNSYLPEYSQNQQRTTIEVFAHSHHAAKAKYAKSYERVCVSTVYLSILQLSSFPAANWNCRKLEMRARECIVRVFPIVGTHHSHLVPFSFAHCVLYETNIFALSSFIWSDVFCSGLLRTWNQSQRQSLHLACICRSGSENGYYFFIFILWASFSLFAWAAFAFVFIFRILALCTYTKRRITFYLLSTHFVKPMRVPCTSWYVPCISGSAIAITTHEQNVYIARHCVSSTVYVNSMAQSWYTKHIKYHLGNLW